MSGHEEIKKDPQWITKAKSFENKYEWEEINFQSEKDSLKKFEKNNVTIALNTFYAKKGNIYPACVSKHNSNREKQVILLMIPNRKRALSWIKQTISILREITSKH